ncbi:hypothetical protein [Bdellovibrio sp. HCB337]|uniref:hypothetical protein n=1 Tax=Bdellovibrio sp. HCB337 TaxID=3394358 RepID=UPI0039A5DFAE
MLTTRAEARVFNINSEKFAGYFLATGGPSAIGQNAFLNEDATSTTYSADVKYNYTGEFGFLYSRPYVSMRFGFEVFKPSMLKDVVASSGATEIYSLNSDVVAFAPKLGIEFNVHSTANYRSFIQVFGGSASVSYKNDYTIISYGGQSDHSVSAKGTTTYYGGSLGVESHMTDTTTYIFEFGYRKMLVDNLKYSKDVTTFQGAQTAGSPVLDIDGNPRTLDFSGGFISIGFRFYL